MSLGAPLFSSDLPEGAVLLQLRLSPGAIFRGYELDRGLCGPWPVRDERLGAFVTVGIYCLGKRCDRHHLGAAHGVGPAVDCREEMRSHVQDDLFRQIDRLPNGQLLAYVIDRGAQLAEVVGYCSSVLSEESDEPTDFPMLTLNRSERASLY